MTPRRTVPTVPRDVIPVTTYALLDRYLDKFSSDELGLVLLLGRPGTGKSESVRHVLSVPDGTADDARRPGGSPLYIEGHMQPFGLYRQLWEFRNRPIVLDDLDRLYADPDCVRLLKPLCNTVKQKRLHWLSNLTMSQGQLPSSFVTSSNVILIANEWKSLNPNVRALEDLVREAVLGGERGDVISGDGLRRAVKRRHGRCFGRLRRQASLDSQRDATSELTRYAIEIVTKKCWRCSSNAPANTDPKRRFDNRLI